MLYNNFKIAWRNMVKNRIFSIINIVGLTVGLCAFLLIALYIFDELTFDRFHSNTAGIYRVILHSKNDQGKLTNISGAGYMVSEKAKTDFPEIKQGVRLAALGRSNVSTTENKNVFYEDFVISNQDFLQTFDFKLLKGNRDNALEAPHSVLVTEETALKLFNTKEVLGKFIMTERDSIPFRITGLLQNFPVNSHISFNLLFSESTFMNDRYRSRVANDWSEPSFTTYFLLDKKANSALLEDKINQLTNNNLSADEKGKTSYSLQPLKDIHFQSTEIEGNLGRPGSMTYIYVFSTLAIFILVIACINYINLTTSRFTNRAKEIAVRKVTGASRYNLAMQFLSEAFLMTGIALGIAILLTKFLLPYFNAFTEKQLDLGVETDPRIWFGIVIAVILVGMLSGTYPALFQSRLQPLLLLKNKARIGKGNISLRRSLVVFQFSLSIIMIVATLVVLRQMNYVNNKDMGFSKDHLVVVDINSGKVRRSAQIIKNELDKMPEVKSITISSRVPGEWKNLPTIKIRNEQLAESRANDVFFIGVDEDFLAAYQVKLIQGRNFLAGSANDSTAVLLNETAARLLGITTPSEQLLNIPAVTFGGNTSPLDAPFKARVIGIVKDFNFQSLYQPIAPIVLGWKTNPVQSIDYFTARVESRQMETTLEKFNAVLHNVDQNHLFEYHFLDKQWNLFYREDQMRQTIFLIVAVLAIFIACLGLFGLATYAAENRIKEIGIRKVLGASVGSIITMLSKEFVKLVLIALIIAFPIAWLTMYQWLQNFAFRTDLSWWIFLISGAVAMIVALLTISFQAVRAALRNPVKSLRTE
jgi:putative ABC transport system permease protein